MKFSTTLITALSVLTSTICLTLARPMSGAAPAPVPEIQGRALLSRFAPKARPVFPRTVFDNYTTKRDAMPEAAPEALPVALPEALPEALPLPAPVAEPEAVPNPVALPNLPLGTGTGLPFIDLPKRSEEQKRDWADYPAAPVPASPVEKREPDHVARNLFPLPTVSIGVSLPLKERSLDI